MAEYIIRKRTTLDQVEFPKIVYKYREADNVLHRTILTEGKVFFSPPIGFEDKLDCKIPIRYDLLTEDDIFNKYYNELKETYPHYNDEYLIQEAKKWMRAGLMQNTHHIKQVEKKYWDELNERFGVLSLTADPQNLAMWNKYSKMMNGFCVGFASNIMFQHLGGGGEVSYVQELPIIKPFEDYDVQHLKQVFYKEQKWSFEKEYRTHKLWPSLASIEDRKIAIPGDAFAEIIVGQNVGKEVAEEIVSQAKMLNPAIRTFTANIEGDSIKIIDQ